MPSPARVPSFPCAEAARSLAFLCAMLLLLAPSARLQIVDAQILPGDSFQGDVESADDVDVVTFDGLGGELVTLKAVAGKGSTLVPRIELFAAGNSAPVASVEATKKSTTLKAFELPTTGTWRVHVSGVGGSVGAFTLKTKVGQPKSLKKPVAQVPGPDSALLEFDAHAESLLTLKISASKKSGITLVPPKIAWDGGQVDPSDVLTMNAAGTSVQVKKLPLPAFATYTVTIEPEGGAADALKISAKLTAKKVKKTLHVEPLVSIGHPWAIAFDPSLASLPATDTANLALFGIVVPLLPGISLPTELGWTVDGADAQHAEGTVAVADDGTWATIVPLFLGEDEIVVDAGEGVTRKLSVTHNEGYAFGGKLDLSPDVVTTQTGELVTARILLTDPKTDATSVSLVVLGDDGGKPAFVTALVDDGSRGDEVAGDGLFTGTFSPPDDGAPITRHYRVVVLPTSGPFAQSETDTVTVVPPRDEALWEVRNAELSQLSVDLQLADDAGGLAAALDQAVSALKLDPQVLGAGVGSAERGLWVLYSDGTPVIVSVTEEDVRSAGPAREPLAAAGPVLAADPATPIAPTTPTPSSASSVGAKAAAPTAGLRPYRGARRPKASWSRRPTDAHPSSSLADKAGYADPNVVGTQKALVLSPYYFQFAAVESTLFDIERLKSIGMDVEPHLSSFAGTESLDTFKDWSDGGVIFLSSHANTYMIGIDEGNEGAEVWLEAINPGYSAGDAVVFVATNVPDDGSQFDELVTGRVVKWLDVAEEQQIGVGSLLVSPGFFEEYQTSLPNSLVYLGACRSAYNGSLVSVLLELGAGAVLGWSEYVSGTFEGVTSGNLFFDLTETKGATLDSAFVHAVEPDGKFKGSTLTAHGNLDLSLFEKITDPSFEDSFGIIDVPVTCGGSVQGWSFEKSNGGTHIDVSIISDWMGLIEPTDGDWMAAIEIQLVSPADPSFDLYSYGTGKLSQAVAGFHPGDAIYYDWNLVWYCDWGDNGVSAFADLLTCLTGQEPSLLTLGFLYPLYYQSFYPVDCSNVDLLGIDDHTFSTGWTTSALVPPFASIEDADFLTVTLNAHAWLQDYPFTPRATLLLDNFRLEP